MVKVPSRRAQGLHLLLHLQDSDSVAEKHVRIWKSFYLAANVTYWMLVT